MVMRVTGHVGTLDLYQHYLICLLCGSLTAKYCNFLFIELYYRYKEKLSCITRLAILYEHFTYPINIIQNDNDLYKSPRK